MNWETFKQSFITFFSTSGLVIFKAILIFVVGYFLIAGVLKLLIRVLSKARIDKSARKFIYIASKYVMYFLLVMIIASVFNISITGFVAVFSAVGLAVSLALQGSLSNLANGIVILISKPFKEGDAVSINGFDGTILEIRLMHTIINGVDGRQISIPNKAVVENVIVNSSASEQKRIRYTFLVGYASDVEKVKQLVTRCFEKTNYILPEPKPFVGVEALTEKGISFVVTCFVESKNFPMMNSALLEDIFNDLKKEKIALPYAQVEVRNKTEKDVLPFYNQTKLTNKPEEKVKPVTHLETEAEKPEPAKPQKEYLDFSDEEVEIEPDDEDLSEPSSEQEQETQEKTHKDSVKTKILRKFQNKEKKPTIIIKKK